MSITLDGAMEHLKIDKISDDVYTIAPNVVLKFNVSLSKISGGKRYHYHKEYEYPSKMSPECNSLVTIKRSFDYYLSFENQQKDINGNRLFIRIGVQEYFLLKNSLETVISWFRDTKYAKLFALDRGRLILVSPVPNCKIQNLPMNKYIEFTPTIIDRGISNADKEPGIKIEFGDPSMCITINLDKLMGLYYLISCFNMYQAAITMINYVSRPDFGTNRYVMDQQRTLPTDNDITGVSGIRDRYVTPIGVKNNISSLEG